MGFRKGLAAVSCLLVFLLPTGLASRDGGADRRRPKDAKADKSSRDRSRNRDKARDRHSGRQDAKAAKAPRVQDTDSAFVAAAKAHQKELQHLKLHPKRYPALTPGQRRDAVRVPRPGSVRRPAPGLRRADGDFNPGDLTIPREEVLGRCLVPQKQYEEHLLTGATMTSAKHRVALLMGPKAGSSTSRHLILLFQGKDEGRRGLRRLGKDIWRTWLVREPLSRFYAQYEEMIARSFQHNSRDLPAEYRFRDGLPKYDTYAALFDDPEGVESLSRRFEVFVQEYDGRKPFDVHLVQQVPSLSTSEGPLRADLVAETKDMARVLHEIREHAKPRLADETLIRSEYTRELIAGGGRAFPRRLNVSLVSDEAKQRVCMLTAVDYCCLNWVLPDACRRAPRGSRVRCAFVKQEDGRASRIEPVIA